jgi:hypothetical protein
MVVKDKWRRVSFIGLVLFFTLACESVSNLFNEVGIPEGEGMGGTEEGEIFFSEDGPEELSSFCKSMLPMGIFTRSADAEGRFYLEGMQGFNGGYVQCVFEWTGDGVWCEWGIEYNRYPIVGCMTTPDPQRNRPVGEECVQTDRLSGQLCGEYDGVSITGITKGSGVRRSYIESGNTGVYEETKDIVELSGVMWCNVMQNGRCEGEWTVTSVYGDWWIELP